MKIDFKRLEKILKKEDITLRMLCYFCEITHSSMYVARKTGGESLPETIDKIAHVLRVKPEDIILKEEF